MNEQLIEALAEQVHISWMAEKQRQNFADHVYQTNCLDYAHCDDHCSGLVGNAERCPLSRQGHHPDMLPYADLAENVKEYDRATVRAVLRALDAAGLQIVQTTTQGAR